MNNNLSFTDYDRISDQLLWLSDSIKLSFSVTLSSKDRSGSRRSFYYETEYDSRYIGTRIGRGIKRNMSFYYVIETSEFGNSLLLRPHDVYFLTSMLENNVIPWFFGKTRIYSEKDNKLVISGKFEPLSYRPYPNQYLFINPIVFDTDQGFIEGVRMEVCNPSMYADIDINKFFDLYHILKSTDMYSVASTMMNFVKTQPYGENIFRRVGLGGGGNPDEGWEDSNMRKSSDDNKGSNDFLNRKR